MPSDALRDPVQWNLEWEALFRPGGQLVFPRGPVLAYSDTLRELEAAPSSADKTLRGYQVLVANTCALQRNITAEALQHFTHDDFEARWMNADADVRGRHILGAMAAVCSKAQNLNQARSYCPEVRLMRLRLDGKVFLNLLKSVMLADASFIPSQPVYVCHSAWDTWAATLNKESDAEKIAFADIQILRTKLICHVVQFTIRSFFNKDAPRLIVEKPPKSSQTQSPFAAQAKAEAVALLGPEGAKARFKEEKAGFKARRNERLGHCSYMGCHNSEPEDGSKKFRRCKLCFDKLQRQVLYCSADCQKADRNLRHKAICGKPYDFETAAQVMEHPINADTSHMRIGPPVDGYKRSIALIAQVTALNLCPTVDYQLYDAAGDPVNIVFDAGSYIKLAFRDRREWAMTSGHLGCLAQMAQYLCLSNLTREFEDADLSEAILFMQKRQDDDPLHRPPLLEDMPPDDWLSFDQRTNVSEIIITLNQADMGQTR
ncbi:hypothetical protein C8R47DRAFT_1260782 [Mycena vitilis]|nr:hypothetical protein C8R47DRAFT_1260782 [Mycena vitilis]